MDFGQDIYSIILWVASVRKQHRYQMILQRVTWRKLLIKQHLKQEFSRNPPHQLKDQITKVKATKIKACSGKTFGIPPPWRQASALASKATNYIHRRHEMFQNVSIFAPRCQCVHITCTGRMKWLIHFNSMTYFFLSRSL